MDCFDESLHPYLKIFYQAAITCNLVVEGDFMQASHRASQITSVDDGHRHRQGLCMIRSRTQKVACFSSKGDVQHKSRWSQVEPDYIS